VTDRHPDSRRLRIVLIEDSLADVGLIREALREHDVPADLEVLADGETAFRYWDRFFIATPPTCPDLVLLDLNLPKRSGFEILRRIREVPHWSAIGVVRMSSSTSARDMQQASALGILHYFRKPTHFDEFLELGRLIKSLDDRKNGDS
jgi:two-component system, chemotaxis family, response regulator Rcp1